jgi:hypothetical protein
MVKDNNKKESYQQVLAQEYSSNKVKFATVGSTLKTLSKNKHLWATLATNFEGGTPIRFYIYFAKVQQIGIEFTSLS